MTDCINCIHKGNINGGKLHCFKFHEDVEPINNTYPADSCSCYKDKDGNTNPDATACPFCNYTGIYQETGSNYHTIKCCKCGLTIMKDGKQEAIRVWNNGGIE